MASTTERSLSDVPDILYDVFSYLDPIHQSKDDGVYESRRSLAVLARTCRGFTGPALDILWKRLPDDQPLADLLCELGIAAREGNLEDLELSGKARAGRYRLPHQDEGGLPILGAAEAYEKRWKLSRGYDRKYSLWTAGDPRAHPGWPRFVEYASRVRAIILFAFDGPAWCGIWEELLALTERVPILPRLLSVSFRYFSSRVLNPGAFALISPSVRNINLNINVDGWCDLDEKFRCLFTQSFNATPEIEGLRLEFHPSILGPSLLQTHCSRLHHLEVYPLLDLKDIWLLTELPALQHLSISLSRQNSLEAGPLLTFESVTTLAVEGTWANLGALLDIIRLPSMHTLSVTGWDHGDPAAELAKAATQCFRILATRHPSLTRLEVSATHGRVPPSLGCVVYDIPFVDDTFEASLVDLIHPLLALSALRHLTLGFQSYFDISCTTVDLRAVAEAFPVLEAFHLRIWPYFGFAIWDDEDPPERPRGGPLHTLAHFALNCPRLRVLHLPAMEMATETQVDDDERRPSNSEPHGLRTLVIPKVLLPSGREDLAGKVEEVVRGVFPFAAFPFRSERLVVEEGWAMTDGASRCPECARGLRLTFA